MAVVLVGVLVLLDQKDWIGLAKADRRRNPDAVYVALLARVRALKSAGWTFLLNTSRYHETSQTPSVRHRRDVAMIMQEISDYRGLLDPTTCLHMEMSSALHARVPEVIPMQLPVLGRGATHKA